MNDLTDRLARLDGTAATPADDVVAADLARGGTALTRRRHAVGAAAGVGLTLALGAGLGIAVVAQPDDAAAPPAAGRSEGRTSLVAYTGEQPEGFEVAVIPEGFFVQGSDAYVFTVAPEGDTSHPLAFEDKIVVSLEDGIKKQGAIEGEPVMVGDVEGGIRTPSDGLATMLEFMQGDFNVVVQMWRTVGLTDEELIEFAEGITVTDEAKVPGLPTGDQGTSLAELKKDGKIRITPEGEQRRR